MSGPAKYTKLRRSGTVASGIVILGLLSGGLIAAAEWDRPEVIELGGYAVDVPAGPVTMVCPGPPRLATEAAGEDLDYDEFNPEVSGTNARLDVVSLDRQGHGPGQAGLELASGQSHELDQDNALRVTHLAPLAEPATLRAAPTDDMTALAAGTTTAITEDGDLRGLAVAGCLLPGTSAGFVAGSTEIGGSAQLLLSNPGATAATVALDVWGATGPVDTRAVGSVLVPPRSQQVVLLEAAAPEQARVALQLRATGGEISAHLQVTQLDGLTPAGTDIVTPGAEAATEQILPGVVLGEGTGDGNVLRLLNPGDDEARVSVELLGTDDIFTVPGGEDIAVDPGTVVDVSLAGLPAGEWAVRVSADHPVAASALVVLGEEGAPRDRMWVAATRALMSSSYVFPQDFIGEAILVLANSGQSDESVRIEPFAADGTRGEGVEFDLGAGRSHIIDVNDIGDDVLAIGISTQGVGVHSGMVLTAAEGALGSWLAPTPDPHAVRAVDIAPWSPGLS